MIDQFAALTGDPVEIHTNVELAKQTPFGGTIAHGLLSLSMLGGFAPAAPVLMEGITMGLNYGFNKVRFVTPVKTGSRLRGRFHLRDMQDQGGGKWLSTMDVTIEIEGDERPAVVAEWLGMQFVRLRRSESPACDPADAQILYPSDGHSSASLDLTILDVALVGSASRRIHHRVGVSK